MPYQTDEALETGARRGRPATASREDVLRLVREQFLAGQRVDLTVVARELGLGRATIYRWFGSRDGVLGEVIVDELQVLLDRHRLRVRLRGAKGLLEVFDRVNRALSRSQPLRRLLEQERESALRMLTSGGGPVQARAVAAIQAVIDEEVTAGRYDPPADTGTLASRSSGWPTRSCTTTRPSGSAATGSACDR